MNYSILGPVEAVGDDGQLPLGGPRQRALLACLLVHANKVVASDRLVDELWATPPRDAHAALQNQVSRLRKVVGGRLVTRGQGYLLRVEEGELDLDHFRALVARAGSTQDARERSQLLREADALFRGEPFGEIDAPFAAGEAAALEELRLAALEARVDADLERGRHAELVPELASLVVRHPLRERLRGQHILALYRSGRQAEALEAYRATRSMLDEELGLEPSPALRELELAILRHDPALARDRVDDEPSPAAPPEPPGRRFRPPVLAVALGVLAVAAAGAAAAVLLTRSSPRPAPAAAAPLRPAADRHAATLARARQRPKPSHAVSYRRRQVRAAARPLVQHAPAAKVKATRRRTAPAQHAAHAPVAAPTATTAATTTTSAKPKKPTNVTPTVTTQTATPPPSDWRQLTDDFSGSSPNWAMWSPNTDGTGASYAQQNGRLEFTLDGSGQPGGTYDMLSASLGTRCRFDADFDARVDYTLLTWAPPAGVRVQLSGWTPDPPYADVARTSNQWGDSYYGDVAGTYNGFPTSDQHGTLRIARSGATIAAYYLDRGKWVLLNSGTGTGRVMLGLQVFAMANEWTNKTARVAFDNFVVAAPQVVCP